MRGPGRRGTGATVVRAATAAAALMLLGIASCGDEDSPSPPADVTPPTVTMVRPQEGDSLGTPRSYEFQARANDEARIARVEFFLDDAPIGDGQPAGEQIYGYHWQNPGISSGTHRIAARATDTSANQATTEVSFKIGS